MPSGGSVEVGEDLMRTIAETLPQEGRYRITADVSVSGDSYEGTVSWHLCGAEETEAVEREKAGARQRLREWVGVTGAVSPESSWYYEIEAMLEEAVERGWGAAPKAPG